MSLACMNRLFSVWLYSGKADVVIERQGVFVWSDVMVQVNQVS